MQSANCKMQNKETRRGFCLLPFSFCLFHFSDQAAWHGRPIWLRPVRVGGSGGRAVRACVIDGVLLCLLSGTCGASAAPRGEPSAAPTSELRAQRADLERIQRILSESQVETSVPKPAWSEYFRELYLRFWMWVARRLDPLGPAFKEVIRGLGYFILVIAGCSIVALLIVIGQMIYRSYVRRRASAPLPLEPANARSRAAGRNLDPAWWRRELERRLDEPDAPAALEALWWWFACAVAGGRLELSWTTREVALHAGRRDLLPLVSDLDVMAYGIVRPDLARVRELTGSVDRVLG